MKMVGTKTMNWKSFTKILGFVLFIVISIPIMVSSQSKTVQVAKVDGPINALAVEYIINSIETAEEEGAQCLILQLDTPGGMYHSTKDIVKKMLNAEVPVVVYVSPSGASASSAGVFITMAGHIAAMAPGTNIGAAHPVSGEGKDIGRDMRDKVENDAVSYIQGIAAKRNRNAEWAELAVRESVSVEAEEALALHVIDFISPSIDDLLQQIDGMKIDINGREVILATKDVQVQEKNMTLRDRILYTLSDPNIAYILMMLGIAGLYFELMHPGGMFPGILGAICLILGFYSLQTLPVNYAGLLLILLAIGLFILEIKVSSYGLLSMGGIICLVIGSLMLFDSDVPYLRLSMGVLVTTVLLAAGFFIMIATLALRAQLSRPASGSEGMVGMKGIAKTTIAPQGKVFVHGEYWNASSDEEIKEGDEIEVTATKGLKVTVKRVTKN